MQIRDRLKFALERLLLRGLHLRLLLAAAIVGLVALSAGVLVAQLDPELARLDDAIWWAFLRLTDPGYLGDDEGVARRSISTVVTVLGYVLFLGLLIAILTQWLNEFIARVESGVTPVRLRGHVLILGWTHRTPTIACELLRTRGRVQRFLDRHGVRQLRIVILAERVDQRLALELRERLGSLWNDRQVLLRAGTPLRVDHLERVAFRDAAALILPGADFADRNPGVVDAQTVKTLRAVSHHLSAAGAALPLAVAELYDRRRAEVARGAYAGRSEIVAADGMLSQLIAQSVYRPGLSEVFGELLSVNVGCALHVRNLPELAGSAFGDLRPRFTRAIPVGLIHARDGLPALNPVPETVLAPGDLVVFLARNHDDCGPGEASAVERPAASRPSPVAEPERRRLLVLGWSRRVPPLLRELEGYGEGAFEIDVVSATPLAQREPALREKGPARPEGWIRQIEASYTVPGVLRELEAQSYDHVAVLASEWLEEEEEADAATIFTCLMLEELLAGAGARPQLLVELMSAENELLLAEHPQDVIVSPLVVSYMLSQVVLRPELAPVFGELSSPWGGQLELHPATAYLGSQGSVQFGELERAAARRGEIALGLRRPERLLLAPDSAESFELTPDDEVVVLTTRARPEAV